jgi:GGDEF domain-containing protein
LPESVGKLVQSLIGPNDFAAQSSEDEFLLIYPQERGASAQRRLAQIAQQLWEFQLHSLGSLQILFSWGGVEVRSESIEKAIASASERMKETKRGRKLLTMQSPAPVDEANSQLRQVL